MEEINYVLGYENLKIYQNSNMFKFSLDSVLLANFVTINKKHTSNLRDMKHVPNVNGSFSTFKVMRSLSQTQCTQCIQNSIFFKKPPKKYNIFICDDERQTAISTQNLLNRYFKKKSNPESFPDIFIVPDGIQCLFQTLF